MELLHTVKYKNHTINVFPDSEPFNPREEFEHVGLILYVSRRYVLGDKMVSEEEIENICKRDDIIYLPVYAYMHGNTILNTTGFSCPWDSGRSGVIYCTVDKARVTFPHLTKETLVEKVKEMLNSEVEEYSRYLSGQVYGYTVTNRFKEEVDSCWGFLYDNVEDVINEAKFFIDHSCSIDNVCSLGNVCCPGQSDDQYQIGVL